MTDRTAMLIKQLRTYNRRERFILLQAALGSETFTLDAGFRRRLGLPSQRMCRRTPS